MKDCIIVLDIETTGFSPDFDYIVEIGAVSLNVVTGEILPLINEVVWEKGITREICDSSWICKNSTLNAELIRKGLHLPKIKNLIQTIINAYPLGTAAFNSDFDFRFLDDRGFTVPVKLPCPMKVSTDYFKLNKKNFKGGYKYPSVVEAYTNLFPDEAYVELHRGLSDAVDEAKIIYKLIQLGVYKIE